jgi:hypothetical protein
MTQHPTTTKEEANGLQKSHDWLIDYLHCNCSLSLPKTENSRNTTTRNLSEKPNFVKTLVHNNNQHPTKEEPNGLQTSHD